MENLPSNGGRIGILKEGLEGKKLGSGNYLPLGITFQINSVGRRI